MRIGLGTAQFGNNYGFFNKIGKTSLDDVEEILAFAEESGIEVLDTASSYGDSEVVLGKVLPTQHRFRIVTKTPVFNTDQVTSQDACILKQALELSLTRLRSSHVYGLLVHYVDDLLVPGGRLLIDEMQKLVNRGLVERIGVSLYTGEQIDRILELFTPDIIQLPVSVFDQRLRDSGHLKKLKNKGVEIHARSVFLQGLLLIEPELIPPYFESISAHFSQYTHFLEMNNLSRLQAALMFALEMEELDTVLVGVSCIRELKEIASAINTTPDINSDMSFLAIADEKMLNPLFWKL
jgi:aryl-alcohol dehydrogenase-like predicted oxidoreductase